MQLSRATIKKIIPQPGLLLPEEPVFGLPEKVLQFGTGVLLRGLPDYFIDKANRQGLFNGRIVLVKSTARGGTDHFDRQDGLYTLCIKGVEDGIKREETIVNASVSRVLSAADSWAEILACAHNPEMQVIISNTTEVGITLVSESISQSPPVSFPGKLLAFLRERYAAFKGSAESGMVILPTELIPDNGKKLRAIVLELARINQLDPSLIRWIETANHFCNTLVDRIVPGRLPDNERYQTEKKLGYSDPLLIMAESFRLWAIETGEERVRNILSFAAADEGIVIAPDIEKFRELKLRLLNGTHTFSCGLACLAGFGTVREAMGNEHMSAFIQQLALTEIAVAVAGTSIPYAEAVDFGKKVLDRFRNPFIDHHWSAITVQYSSKMKMRNLPLLFRYYRKTNQAPELMATGFAAFLLFMNGRPNGRGQFEGTANGKNYIVEDDQAAWFADKWKEFGAEGITDAVLSDKNFWGDDPGTLTGFIPAVRSRLRSLIQYGAMATLRRHVLNKPEVR